MNYALFSLLGLFIGSMGTALFARMENMTSRCDVDAAYVPQLTLQISEEGAKRCDRELLTCLGVQVRFIGELEALQDVCAKQQRGNDK